MNMDCCQGNLKTATRSYFRPLWTKVGSFDSPLIPPRSMLTSSKVPSVPSRMSLATMLVFWGASIISPRVPEERFQTCVHQATTNKMPKFKHFCGMPDGLAFLSHLMSVTARHTSGIMLLPTVNHCLDCFDARYASGTLQCIQPPTADGETPKLMRFPHQLPLFPPQLSNEFNAINA